MSEATEFPAVDVGQVLRLDDGDGFRYGEVRRRATMPELPLETITVGPNSTETDFEASKLEVWDGWIGQYRFERLADELPADVTARVDLGGRQAPIWVNKNSRSDINRDTGSVLARNPSDDSVVVEDVRTDLTEIWVREQDTAYLTVRNESGSQVEIDLTACGYLYQLQSTSSTRAHATAVVGSVGGD